MATVRKLNVTRWYVADPDHPKGRRETKPNAPGAIKVIEKTSTYFIVWKEAGRTKREATGVKDKKSAQAALHEFNVSRERGEYGLTDPRQQHLDKAIGDHVAEYMTTLAKRDTAYRREVERVLKLATKDMKTLRDFTAEKLSAYLRSVTSSASNANKHRTYLSGFSRYVYRMNYIATNPIDRVDRLKPGHAEPESRTRRPYSEDELRRLMSAARIYPLVTRGGVNKGGRPRKDGTPAQHTRPTQLSDEYKAKLTLQGRERELVYRVALATGLRRGELSRVTTSMYNGNKLLLPKSLLKHKPKHITHVIIPIVPSLAADLSKFLKDNPKQPQDRLLNVPNRSNLIREHMPRLKLANIPYETEFGYADVHALRTTANAYLKRNNIPLDVRQRFLRHTPRDITSKNYDPDCKRPITMTVRVYKLLNELDKLITRT